MPKRGQKPPPGWDGRCLARSKTTGEQCKQKALPPTTKCHYHGGRALRGVAHPNFKHGLHTELVQAVPKHMREIFIRTMQRDDLVHLRGEISLLETREYQLLEQLQGGGSPEFWKRLRSLRRDHDDLQRELEEARAEGSKWDQEKIDRAQEKVDAVTREILGMIDQGAKEADVWKEILESVEMRRRLSDTERRRLEMLQQVMTPDQALAFASHLVNIVRDVVSDRNQLSAIVARVQLLLPGRSDDGAIIDAEPVPAEEGLA